ncbi:hypothetical protein P4S95_22270 [Aneurinibacillus aneurinilyticus]|uniref:hypothetical protein n=1 Tax=Aneurinibacillus aneurinilyticus TaxID=1391 RepID=UPI002E1CD88A|nr:hypothetical protein [Aneurinibacillus aneurinilyticus]
MSHSIGAKTPDNREIARYRMSRHERMRTDGFPFGMGVVKVESLHFYGGTFLFTWFVDLRIWLILTRPSQKMMP